LGSVFHFETSIVYISSLRKKLADKHKIKSSYLAINDALHK